MSAVTGPIGEVAYCKKGENPGLDALLAGLTIGWSTGAVTYIKCDPVNAVSGQAHDRDSYQDLKDAEHQEPLWKGHHMTAGHVDGCVMVCR